jgi:hypothetical protein
MNGLAPDSSEFSEFIGPDCRFIKVGERMTDKIGVSKLRNISVLFEGDLYDFANLMLKIYDAKNKGTNTVTRDTVIGLVHSYSLLARVNSNQVLAVIKRKGLPLGSTIEHDKDVT